MNVIYFLGHANQMRRQSTTEEILIARGFRRESTTEDMQRCRNFRRQTEVIIIIVYNIIKIFPKSEVFSKYSLNHMFAFLVKFLNLGTL